jgi:acetyl-CoA carboxylase biotin carboxyl carrier protein
MDPNKIKSFIDAMAASDLEEMEISHEGWTLRLVRRRSAGAASAPTTSGAASAIAGSIASVPPARAVQTATTPLAAKPEVLSPMFGVVHLQQAPGDPPFVRLGQAVEAGALLCIIEAMKVFNEVHAERSGTVAAILVQSGQEVEAGQRLLRLE